MPTAVLVVVDVVLVLAVARALRGVLVRARQPPVMAEVLAGLVLGASVLGALPGDPTGALFTEDARAVLAVAGQVAVVGYLFAVAAELDPHALRREGRAVALVAGLAFAVPWIAGVGLAVALRGAVATDPPLVPFMLFLGTALAVTALPVLSRIVAERGLAGRPAGRVALAAAAAQELLVWPALAVAVALAGTGDAALGGVLARAALAVALVLALGRVAVPALAARLHDRPLAAGVVVLAGLAASALATELAGLHVVLGAFLYGVALPAPVREPGVALLRARPLALASAVLLPLFFALPALRVDVGALGLDGLGLLALVLAVAAGTKLASATAAARLAGLERREARVTGALMNARGLVELVVLSVGLDAGLVDDRLFAVMVLMALATTFATGPLADRLGRAPRAERGARRARAAPAGS